MSSSSSQLGSVALFLLTCRDSAGKPFMSNVSEKPQNTWIAEVDEAVIVQGWASTLFRKLISGLLFEWTQKHVPHEREAGFQQAVLKILRSSSSADSSSPPANVQYWFPQENVGPLDVRDRIELLRFLAGQVRVNRCLEFRVFENADVAADVSEIKVTDDVQASEAMLCDVVGAKDLAEAAKLIDQLVKTKYVVVAADSTSSSPSPTDPSNSTTTTSVSKNHLAPVFNTSELDTILTADDWKLLESLNAAFQGEYTERRRAARSRFAQALLSMSTSAAASLDRVELRRRGDAELALLGEAPGVGPARTELVGMRRVELLELAGSVRHRKQATRFALRCKTIPEVPDRGGRVNTHNFERKVTDASSRADAQMKGKSQFEAKQRSSAAQSMHVDAAMGVGFMSSNSAGNGENNNYNNNSSNAQQQQQGRGRGGGGGGMGSRQQSNSNNANSGAHAAAAAGEIRSRGGGRWSSDRNNGK